MIRAEAETCFLTMNLQINLSMLLLLLMTTSLVHIKEETIITTMLSQTFAHIRNLSYQLPDQPRADRAMHQLLMTNIKLTRKVLTSNVLKAIMKRNIGTNDVEKYVEVLSKQNVRKKKNTYYEKKHRYQ